LYVIFASFSDGAAFVKADGFLLKPAGFSFLSYQEVFKNKNIVTGYKNILIILALALPINVILTSFAAFFMTRENILFKKPITLMIIFTMFFGGGLIPSFLLVKGIGLYNSIWAVILPGAVSTFNIIIMRTYFYSIPSSMEESATIDGAGLFTILFRIILPLSKPVVAVMILYYGVGHWNSWFGAMIYLSNPKLWPLQLVLRDLLMKNDPNNLLVNNDPNLQSISETVKYATIVVATLPILALYPFLQKYFVSGIMIGAVKG
jgi:putative aldouronate transport system permease protein